MKWRNDKKLNTVLDECLERLVRGETVEKCLESYPDYAAELEPLLRTAIATREAVAIEPRPELKARVRYQLHAEFQEMESRKRHWSFVWQPRWATAVAVVLILLVMSSGTVMAASESMPDQPLYAVKIATERARLALTLSAVSRAELYARLTDKRVAEIVYLASKGDTERVEMITHRLDNQLTNVAVLVAARGKPAQEAVMLAPAPVSPRAPEPAPAAGSEKPTPQVQKPPQITLVAPADDAPEVTAQAPPQVPRPQITPTSKQAMLKAILVRKAIANNDRLREALRTAPESVRPALIRAILTSEAGYQKVLESIGEGNR